ncbi:MAG: hypothetical protein IT461_01490 [Planctomycetes bacterium]|nr:hypothetical protein [Planctomycetota bacterium]
MEATLEHPAYRAPSKVRLARGFVLCVALMAAMAALFASWDENGSAVIREARQARQEVKKTVRKVSRPIRNAWRDAKLGWKSL